MCGRLNIYRPDLIDEVLDFLDLPGYPSQQSLYNVAPQTVLPILTRDRRFVDAQWSIQFGNFRHPNSKAATIKRRPDLRQLLQQQRCLVPVNRFYEWPDAKLRPKYQGIKTRFCIHNDADVLLLGGIYKFNADHDINQFNIITTDPTAAINDFHHRSPVILHPDKVNTWLHSDDLNNLFALMRPSTQVLNIYECSAAVNNARNQGPECMASL